MPMFSLFLAGIILFYVALFFPSTAVVVFILAALSLREAWQGMAEHHEGLFTMVKGVAKGGPFWVKYKNIFNTRKND